MYFGSAPSASASPSGAGAGSSGLAGKIHLDPGSVALGGEQAAPRVEAGLLVRLQMAFFPQRVRARQRGVAAKVDLHWRA